MPIYKTASLDQNVISMIMGWV